MCNEATFLSGALGWTAYCDARERAREHHDTGVTGSHRAAVTGGVGVMASTEEFGGWTQDAVAGALLARDSQPSD
jgi:hypothetical protein